VTQLNRLTVAFYGLLIAAWSYYLFKKNGFAQRARNSIAAAGLAILVAAIDLYQNNVLAKILFYSIFVLATTYALKGYVQIWNKTHKPDRKPEASLRNHHAAGIVLLSLLYFLAVYFLEMDQ